MMMMMMMMMMMTAAAAAVVVVVISNEHSRINLKITSSFVLYYNNRVECVIRPKDLKWEKSDHARYRYSSD
jgi:hypothetical protein